MTLDQPIFNNNDCYRYIWFNDLQQTSFTFYSFYSPYSLKTPISPSEQQHVSQTQTREIYMYKDMDIMQLTATA